MKLARFNSPETALCTCQPKYNLNPYLGRCEHACLYCYSVKFPGFRGKARARVELSDKIEAMAKKTEPKLPVMISDATDPYQPLEKQHGVTRLCLKALSKHGFPVLVLTKSDLITRDIDLLGKMKCVVGITVTTLDEEKAGIIEPGAPSPENRIAAMEEVSEGGIPVVARIDPVIPFFNDDSRMLEELVSSIVSAGAEHITVSTLKPVMGFFSSLERVDPDLSSRLVSLYKQGKGIYGYRYLPFEIRRELVLRLWKIASRYDVTFSSCREGLSGVNTSSCDGSARLRI